MSRVSAHYNFIFAYFTSSICSLHPRVIFIKGNDNFNVTFWKKTAFQWLFYSRPSNFTSFLVEGTRTFLERPFSLFWVTFLLTCYRLYFFSRGRYTHVLSTNCTVIIHLLSCFPEGIQVFRDIFRLILTFSRRYSYFFRNENNKIMWEDFTSSICWLRSKMIFFMKMNSNIFAYFTSSICSLHPYSCIFYLEYLLIT